MSTAKHPISVYTIMLILSSIFMLLACIFMAIENYRYEGAPPKARLEMNRTFTHWA